MNSAASGYSKMDQLEIFHWIVREERMQWRATVEQCIAVEEEERSCGCGDSGKGIQQSTFLGFAKVQCKP